MSGQNPGTLADSLVTNHEINWRNERFDRREQQVFLVVLLFHHPVMLHVIVRGLFDFFLADHIALGIFNLLCVLKTQSSHKILALTEDGK